jgi:hypothetical protein
MQDMAAAAAAAAAVRNLQRQRQLQVAARTSRALGAVCSGAWAELFWERDDGDMSGFGARGAFGVEAGAGQWERAGVGGSKWEQVGAGGKQVAASGSKREQVGMVKDVLEHRQDDSDLASKPPEPITRHNGDGLVRPGPPSHVIAGLERVLEQAQVVADGEMTHGHDDDDGGGEPT